MNAYTAAFIQYIKDHPLKYYDVEIESLLDVFYQCYSEGSMQDPEQVKAALDQIDSLTQPLSPEAREDIFAAFCSASAEIERHAFLEGFRVGGQWVLEMR